MRSVLLVSMPWNAANLPSLQLGILSTLLSHTHPALKRDNLHGDLLWLEYVFLRAHRGTAPVDDFVMVAEQNSPYGIGEWVFASALYDSPPDPDGYLDFLQSSGRFTSKHLHLIRQMRALSRNFIVRLADEVAVKGYDVVGFSSTFMQNVASLALARAIKNRNPQTEIILGGANCDGPQGAAIHRNFRFVDYVVRGEGEDALPKLLDALSESGRPSVAEIPGLCWRDARGETVANPQTAPPVPIENVPCPDYESYFHTLDGLAVKELLQPELVLEFSRGCWWGQKQRCTFCGVNGTSVKYRGKSSEQAYTELESTIKRHRVLDIIVVDNVISREHIQVLLPRLRTASWDLNLFWSVRPTLSKQDVQLLAEAGVRRIQPGIESLSSRVLRLMRKGTTAIQNIQLLKWCKEFGVEAFWNILYGFPGETADDYREVLSSMHLLHHLQPPDTVGRLLLVRFSSYFDNSSLGLAGRRPAAFYRWVYQMATEQCYDLACVFDYDPDGLSEQQADSLKNAVEEWRSAHPSATLTWHMTHDGSLCFRDRRPRMAQREHVISGALEVAACRELSDARTVYGLRRRLRTRFSDPRLESDHYLSSWCEELHQLGLLYKGDGRYLTLATPQVDGSSRSREVET